MESEPTRNDVVTVGTTSVALTGLETRKRKVIYLRNTGVVAVTINFGASPAVLGSGIVLNANEYIMDSNNENYECYQGIVTAISSGAGTTVAIFER